MTDEERYCEEMRDLFLTAGWSNLVQELEGLIEDCESIHSVSTLEQLHYNKGMLSVAASILRLPADIEMSELEEEEFVH